jgi:hypothetical protein
LHLRTAASIPAFSSSDNFSPSGRPSMCVIRSQSGLSRSRRDMRWRSLIPAIRWKFFSVSLK